MLFCIRISGLGQRVDGWWQITKLGNIGRTGLEKESAHFRHFKLPMGLAAQCLKRNTRNKRP